MMIGPNGENLAYLLSMPRSGSTLLSLMLGNHSDVRCPPEPWVMLTAAEYFNLGDVKRLPYGRDLAELASFEFILNLERRDRSVIANALTGYTSFPSGQPIELARRILRKLYELHLETSTKRLFIDKTPRYYVIRDLLDEMFPRSPKLVLLRNPLDIFASYKSTWELSASIFTTEGASVHTRDFCEGLFTYAGYLDSGISENTLITRYEDLVTNPRNTLGSICQFLGLEFSEDLLNYQENTLLKEEFAYSPVGDPISSRRPQAADGTRVNSWRTRLDAPEMQALVNTIGFDVFVRMGYRDVVDDLLEIGIEYPSETAASLCRARLLDTLAHHRPELPFSSWNNFGVQLDQCQSDRASRLEVIKRQQADLDSLGQRLEILAGAGNPSTPERAANVVPEAAPTVTCHEAELNELRRQLCASESDREARLNVIISNQRDLDRLGLQLAACQSERSAAESALQEMSVQSAQKSQQVLELKEQLLAAERDCAKQLNMIRSDQDDLDRLQQQIKECWRESSALIEHKRLQNTRLEGVKEQLAVTLKELGSPAQAAKEGDDLVRSLEDALFALVAEHRRVRELTIAQQSLLEGVQTLRGYTRYRLEKLELTFSKGRKQ